MFPVLTCVSVSGTLPRCCFTHVLTCPCAALPGMAASCAFSGFRVPPPPPPPPPPSMCHHSWLTAPSTAQARASGSDTGSTPASRRRLAQGLRLPQAWTRGRACDAMPHKVGSPPVSRWRMSALTCFCSAPGADTPQRGPHPLAAGLHGPRRSALTRGSRPALSTSPACTAGGWTRRSRRTPATRWATRRPSRSRSTWRRPIQPRPPRSSWLRVSCSSDAARAPAARQGIT